MASRGYRIWVMITRKYADTPLEIAVIQENLYLTDAVSAATLDDFKIG